VTDPALAHGSGPTRSTTPGFFATLRYLGQLDLTYLVCESDGELVLVDQHAADERVELGKLRQRRGTREISRQRLLFPATLELGAAQLAIAVELADTLAEVGFEIEPFGKATLAVKAVPAGVRQGEPTQLLRTLLADCPDAAGVEARIDHMLATIACHSAVRAGDRLAPAEAEALLRALDSADYATPGPHGRSVLLRLPIADIARRFGR
jgi:DNA mismatch repair protein MutL